MGDSLTANLSFYSIDGVIVYKAEGKNRKILICLQPGITAEHIEKMIDLSPQEVVLAESALADNTAMSNAYYLMDNRWIKLKIV